MSSEAMISFGSRAQSAPRRRLVRQLLHNSTDGLIPATWEAFASEYRHIDVKALRSSVRSVIEASELNLNEYAFFDLLVHLTITIDRITSGHPLPPSEWTPPEVDEADWNLSAALADAVESEFGLVMPEPERQALYGVVAVRTVRSTASRAELAVDPALRELVSELLADVSARFLLGPADPAAQLNLGLHVQNMSARARSGVPLANPLGDDFKREHPLVHDLALYFADQLSRRLGIPVPPGEVDYLSIHMGMQYMHYLQARDTVTVTLVAPEYYALPADLEQRLERTLRGQAVIEQVVTALEFDFSTVSSDLVISSVQPIGATAAPVVRISPFLTHQDLDRVQAEVQRERERNARRRIRTHLGRLLDPQLYFHLSKVSSREAALQMMTGRMVELGYTDEGFLDDVLERERWSETSFVGEFAIPHSLRMDAKTTGISVLVTDRPVMWGSRPVRLVILLALSPDGRDVFRDALDGIIRLLSENAYTSDLVGAAESFDSFSRALMGLLET